MGDTPHDTGAGRPGHYQQEYGHDDSHLSLPNNPLGTSQPSPGSSRPTSGGAPFFSQYSAIPSSQQRPDTSRFTQQQGIAPYAAGGNYSQPGSNFNMSAIAGALPEYGSQPGTNLPSQMQPQNQRRLSGASTPAVVYQLQQNLQYSHQGSANYPSQQAYSGFGPGQFSGYGQAQAGQAGPFSQIQGQQRIGAMPQQFSQYSPMSPQYYYYPGGYGGGQQPGLFQQQGGQLQSPFGGRGGSQLGSSGSQEMGSGAGFDGHGEGFGHGPSGLEDYQGIRMQPSESSLSSVPRGPPRKPKQSGHALWVGNLPPGATVMDLKDHFSREATHEIESLFLISKSNCAFVNYRTETACQAAMQRFHDSRFHGVRLVCRLRRSSAPSSGIPTGPSAMGTRRASVASSSKSPLLDGAAAGAEETEQAVEDRPEPESSSVATAVAKVPEKFFIVKSLTLQDLEQSVRNGIWATQAHNEQALNKAYESADNVYLIFSANKSGEYYGYARMTSSINENVSEVFRKLPQNEPSVETTDAPRTIPTPATEWAPRGRIIDDSARGTIFWEAELSDEEEEVGKGPAEYTEALEGESGAQVWGKPFKIEWLSTNRLPFYRTRGLRNPWNANREVKIARDGTELETSVGKRLVQMFHRPGPAPAAQMSMPISGQLPPMMGGPSMAFQ